MGAGMSERISLEDVQRIAYLARLTLTPEEAAAMQQDLVKMLDYVAKLESVDTAQVPPTSHAGAVSGPLRHDEVRPGLEARDTLAAAPECLGDGFGVPKIIE